MNNKKILSVIQHYRYHHVFRKKKESISPMARIAFVISFPASWRSVASVYCEAIKKGIDTCIVAVPQPTDGKGNNSTYTFFESQGIKAVPCLDIDGQQNFDLKNWKPDYVFYTRPYNSEYPVEYRSYSVCKYSNICFVPYGFLLKDGYLCNSVYSWSFVLGAKYSFVQSINQKKMCEERFWWQTKRGLNQFEYLGSPRFDFLKQIKSSTGKDSFTIAWMPRWEFRNKAGHDGQSLSHFLDYVYKFMDYVHEYPETNLIIRPHPLMFHTIIEEGVLSESELQHLLEKINSISNIVLDNSSDYINTIQSSDVLVADLTSVLVEYFMTGKPIIYCDTYEGFNDDGKLLAQGLYQVNSWSALENRLQLLENGNDAKAESRKVIRGKFIPSEDNDSASRIIRFLGVR